MRGAAGLTLAVLVGVSPAHGATVGVPTARPPQIVPLRPALRPFRRPFGFRPLIGRRRVNPNLPPRLLPSPPPDTFLQPEGPAPQPPVQGAPEDLPAFAHGFHLTVTVGTGRRFDVPPRLDRFREVGQALGRCFTPPDGFAWGSVTLRVSFRRDGTVFGLPRVPYSDAATADRKSDLALSLLAGLKRCTPLPLSPSLGAAVAGEIFAIRFIHEDKR